MCEFKCEICGEMVWSIPHHLRSCHRSISPMEYWIKYISEDHKQPVCLYCGTPIYWFQGQSFRYGPSKYCCKDCKDADLPRVLKERHADGVYEGTSYLTNTWNSEISLRISSLARTCRARLLNERDCFHISGFYLVEFNDRIKIGATIQEVENYCFHNYSFVEGFVKYHLFNGPLYLVANLEYLIKIKERFNKYLILLTRGYESIKFSTTEEYELGVKDDILDFVNKIPNLTKMK